ncbi:MAG: DUF5010 domain-containing protein [bacterium]|nr:DUF5010 domain-containing protein [bacterium]
MSMRRYRGLAHWGGYWLLALAALWPSADPAAQDAKPRKDMKVDTRFGTFIWGRNNTGQPHWLDGSVFPVVDGQSRLDHMIYVPLDPNGKPAADNSDPAKLARSSYDCARLDYWIDQARQMSAAGLDWVAIDSFGDRPDPDTNHDPKQDRYVVPSMVRGIREARVNLKIAFLDDTPSHYQRYRGERLREQFPGTDANGRPNWMKHRWELRNTPTPPLPVSADMGRRYLAEKWIAGYRHMASDQDLWLTHDGKPPSQGGRPVVFMYATNPEWTDKTTFGHWHEAFAAARGEFKAAFGMEPFLILADCYFTMDPKVAAVADGQWTWAPIAPRIPGPRKGDFTNPATGRRCVAGMVVPGFELKAKTLTHTAERRRWLAMDGTEGDEKHLLETEFALVMADPRPDFVVIGHWNDFQEGQNFGLAIYPTKDGKGCLPPDYYLKAVRNLIDSSRRARPKTPWHGSLNVRP